jgi:hypothetical protein
MFVHLLFCILLAQVFFATTEATTLNSTIEIDLVFPLNQTYAPINPFPVIFIIQNAAAAWNFGFQFLWNINGTSDEEGTGREAFGPGLLFVTPDSCHPAPSDPYIIANSTKFTGTNNENYPLLPGRWSLAW